DLLTLAVLDLGDLFGGHFHLEDVVADVQVLHTGLEVGFDLVLVSGVGVDDVPVAGFRAQVRFQRNRRVDLFGLFGLFGRGGVSRLVGRGGVTRLLRGGVGSGVVGGLH